VVPGAEKFQSGSGYADIIGNGYYVQFRPADVSHYADWGNSAIWFYDWRSLKVPLAAVLLSDMNGKFPWEEGCEQWAIDAPAAIVEAERGAPPAPICSEV